MILRDPGGSTIPVDLIMRPVMSVMELTTLDRIHQLHEAELIEAALAEPPPFILEQRPRVMFENSGMGLNRWLMFGRPASTGSRSARSRTSS